jgi:hypothetical protein
MLAIESIYESPVVYGSSSASWRDYFHLTIKMHLHSSVLAVSYECLSIKFLLPQNHRGQH